MRRSMRRTNRGTGRVAVITWIVLALMVGVIGLRYRMTSRAHAPGRAGAPAQDVQPAASPDATPHVQPRPANERNG